MANDTTPTAPTMADCNLAWKTRGIVIATKLRAALPPLTLRADHIGSTAIPGMATKLTFDLPISVSNLNEAARAFDQPLADRAFQRSSYRKDYVPAGCDDAQASWTKRLWNATPQAPRGRHQRACSPPRFS
ncbi:GrpB family protein [Streptomyces sp. NPDC088748]|uniref:GrpB family protein n=1 Tax=Streptomyces sp. NPDC088748 TaxID=3365887 RepID=UPI003812537F